MVQTILIHGASDDLIEVCGAIGKEFYALYDEDTRLRFDNGDEFLVSYGDGGKWHVDQASEFNHSMTKAEMLPVGTSELLPSYSEICIYRPWDTVESVEVAGKEAE